MREIKSTNIHLRKLIRKLKKVSLKNNIGLWRAVATNLSRPTRIRRKVNIAKLNSHLGKGETAIVPGKVLGTGKLEKKISVAAWQFSESAARKINKVGEAMSISELLEKNPKAKGVKIIG